MRIANAEDTQVIESIWATITPPPITFAEARRAFMKLHRYVHKEPWRHDIIHNERRSQPWAYEQVDTGAVAYEISTRGGWPEFIGHVAQYLGAHEHNRVAIKCVKEVIKRGWLDGRLADRLIPPDEAKAQRRQKKLQSIKDRIERWEAKERRAKNALKKLRAQLKRMEKTQ